MEIKNKKIKQLFSELSDSEIQELFNKSEKDEIIRSVPLLNFIDNESKSITTYWLHARVRRNCYYLYSKYKYHAWTTTDEAGNNKIQVDEIKLRIKRSVGNADYTKSRKNTSSYKHLDEVYGTFNTCGGTKLIATATVYGSSWSVEVKL